ncbi:hypothetical protein [Spirosoma utsteinense]|uniref:Uncharacterized protein n=1 Tax=Spirosoma utsteinense TaxID=2585773 RepID=A0ABR6W8J9_9BACT|nr:hypothetical protein [Spirosoma utsteinense]MBC3787214.1 hypothetical protein [Spirosoma utsteinense]MBC3792899.1 hypothetical protein [Spirosoma utsteinense]
MIPTTTTPNSIQPAVAGHQPLGLLLSASEDEFYGRLQRIWNNVVQRDDMDLIRDEHDKSVYAYRFAEEELHQAFPKQHDVSLSGQNPAVAPGKTGKAPLPSRPISAPAGGQLTVG